MADRAASARHSIAFTNRPFDLGSGHTRGAMPAWKDSHDAADRTRLENRMRVRQLPKSMPSKSPLARHSFSRLKNSIEPVSLKASVGRGLHGER